MDELCLVLDDGSQFLIVSYKKINKNVYKLYGTFNDGTSGYVIVSFQTWTIKRKHPSLEQLLNTKYRILEVSNANE